MPVVEKVEQLANFKVRGVSVQGRPTSHGGRRQNSPVGELCEADDCDSISALLSTTGSVVTHFTSASVTVFFSLLRYVSVIMFTYLPVTNVKNKLTV